MPTQRFVGAGFKHFEAKPGDFSWPNQCIDAVGVVARILAAGEEGFVGRLGERGAASRGKLR